MVLGLPNQQPEKINISFDTYKKVVSEGLKEKACCLCSVCGEPKWKAELGRHRCWEVQNWFYTTYDVASELSTLKGE